METAADPRRPGACRVLVVDDEPYVTELASAWLESLGCDVGVALSGEEALERLGREHWDVLFSDVSMPGGMDGFELAARTRLSWPDVVVAFGTAHGWLDPRSTQARVPMLRKPYGRDELARLLAALGFPNGEAVTR